MKLIYLATPYSHEDYYVRHHRFGQVNAVAARLMNEGRFVFSPISHGHPIALAGDLPTDFAYWREYCFRTLKMCDELLALNIDGWRESTGVGCEIAFAEQQGMPVSYVYN